jgi:hypothetical protein
MQEIFLPLTKGPSGTEALGGTQSNGTTTVAMWAEAIFRTNNETATE